MGDLILNFKEYTDSQKVIVEDLINKFKNIKKHNFKGQVSVFLLSMVISIPSSFFIDSFNQSSSSIFLLGFLSVLISLFFTLYFGLIFSSYSKIFKSYYIEKENFYHFYNSKQKKDIRVIYNNLNEKTKNSLDSSVNINGSLSTEGFLYYFISHYIRDNNILNEYQEIINYINENYHNSDKNLLITSVIEKIEKEDIDYFLNNKDEISEYIYNSKLSNSLKKEALSKIKSITEEELKEDIKNLYKDIKNLNKTTIKTKLVQQI